MPRHWASLALATLLSLIALEEGHSSAYEESRLAKNIEETLDALSKADRKALRSADEFIEATAQRRCRSAHVALKTECLIQEAESHCDAIGQGAEKSYCHLYSDILVVNRLSEGAFLNRSEKYKIMEKYRDYRTQIGKELLYKYAAIVAEFKISGEIEESWFGVGDGDELRPNRNLAVGIRKFCSEFSNRNKMSWQACVGAVVWFIGTSQEVSQPLPVSSLNSARLRY